VIVASSLRRHDMPLPKGKAKLRTLTKIDPSILKPKPQAVSQHSRNDGTRITTTINHVPQPAAPANFDPDVSNFIAKQLEGDSTDDEGVSRSYYVARVCPSPPSTFYTWRLTSARTTRSCY
jgi:hypothetical protein